MRYIYEICHCVPEYVPHVRKLVNDSAAAACNFYEHSSCVTFVKSHYDYPLSQCLPGCVSSEYTQVKAEVHK